jgi:hypothetical protein
VIFSTGERLGSLKPQPGVRADLHRLSELHDNAWLLHVSADMSDQASGGINKEARDASYLQFRQSETIHAVSMEPMARPGITDDVVDFDGGGLSFFSPVPLLSHSRPFFGRALLQHPPHFITHGSPVLVLDLGDDPPDLLFTDLGSDLGQPLGGLSDGEAIGAASPARLKAVKEHLGAVCGPKLDEGFKLKRGGAEGFIHRCFSFFRSVVSQHTCDASGCVPQPNLLYASLSARSRIILDIAGIRP